MKTKNKPRHCQTLAVGDRVTSNTTAEVGRITAIQGARLVIEIDGVEVTSHSNGWHYCPTRERIRHWRKKFMEAHYEKRRNEA